jgi:uncharacterized membrane protein
MGERAKWGVMAALAFIVVGYVVGLLWVPDMRPSYFSALVAKAPLAVFGHIAAGAVALAIGPFQLSSRLRTRRLQLHRWMGRVYIISVVIGGIAAIALATMSTGGLPAHVGFGLLGVLWVLTAVLAYQRIKVYDIADHRRWMIRSYSLAFAAVTFRIYLAIGLGLMRLPMDQVYPTITWLCWVPNLIVACARCRSRPRCRRRPTFSRHEQRRSGNAAPAAA